MGKIGAMQDLVRGIEKIVTKNPTIVDPISEHSGGPNVEALSRRGFMALEDGDWSHAIVFFDQRVYSKRRKPLKTRISVAFLCPFVA